jgi:hypothetical protein
MTGMTFGILAINSQISGASVHVPGAQEGLQKDSTKIHV